MASFIIPAKILKSRTREVMPSLYDFVHLVPRLYNCSDIQTIDNEWRNLDSAQLPVEMHSDDCTEINFVL